MKKKILFIGEDVTLAHISRLIFLADALDKSKYEIHIAHNGKYSFFIDKKMHKRNLDKIRNLIGLPILKNFKDYYVTGTKILYAGTPSIGLAENIPENHHYLGAVCWEPPMDLPERFQKLPKDKPVVYASFGSSGDIRMLEKVVAVLKKMDLIGVITTAGRTEIPESENILVEKYLPASKIIEKSSLVIGNGGSPIVYQALSQGVPILGIPSNIDQYFVMESVEKNKVGKLLRAGAVSEDALEEAISYLLADKEIQKNAKNLQTEIAGYDTRKNFMKIVEDFFSD